MMTLEVHNGYFQIQWLLPKLVLRLETMYEACGQDSIASASIQTYDDMETFELNVVNESLSRNRVHALCHALCSHSPEVLKTFSKSHLGKKIFWSFILLIILVCLYRIQKYFRYRTNLHPGHTSRIIRSRLQFSLCKAYTSTAQWKPKSKPKRWQISFYIYYY